MATRRLASPHPVRSSQHDARLPALHRKALAVAIAAVLAVPAVASAADTTPKDTAKQAATQKDATKKNGTRGQQLQEIVVTGIRASIEDAITVKRDSGSIVEAISSEDIGKLPDTSIADSLSRLPGLTSQRAEGRASAISLRGTDPGFTTALLNGREQVSTGDNRSVEFDQYPAELLNAVVVHKTPDASIMGQGLAGTIDLQTVRPLDYGRQAVVVNMRGEMNSNNHLGGNANDTGYRASFSYIDQYMDGKVGFAFGFARLDTPMATRAFGTYEPWNPSSGGSTFACGTDGLGTCYSNPDVQPGNYTTGGAKVRTDMGNTVRDGYMAVLQFRPNDVYSSDLDMYYSTMDQTDNARSLEVNLGGYPAPCCDGTWPDGSVFGYSNTTVQDNTVVGGTLNNVVPLARNFLFLTHDEIVSTGWKNVFQLANDWSVTGDLSYSKATRKQRQFETNAQYVPMAPNGTDPVNVYDTGTMMLHGVHSMPTLSFLLDYADPANVQVGPTIYGAGYTKAPKVTDELKSFRLDAKRDAYLGWFDSTSFGVNYSDRTKDKISPESGLSTIGGGYHQIADQYLLTPTNLGYAGAGQALAWNVPDVLSTYYDPITYGNPVTLPYLAPKYWNVFEKVWTGYIRGDLNHQISDSVTLKGNLGVQVIRTDQSSTSWLAANAYTADQQVVKVGGGKKYTDVLPQLNFAFLLPDSQAIRIGIAKELARARMDQLKATQESGYDAATGIPGGSGGNPKLDPWRAWALDLSYERYFDDNKAYVSAAAFYKDLKSYIYDQTDPNYDFSSLLAETPPGYFAPGIVPRPTGSLTLPVNGKGGYLYGMELATSFDFSMLSDALDGFGVQLSYSYTESDIKIQGNISSVADNHIPLPGLSKNVWNATLYYEKYGFGARIATRYRSDYIGEVTNFANDRALRYVNADMITDAQISYEWDEGKLKGLQLLLEANNLTNSPYVAYSQSKARLLDYQSYGRQYLAGFTYRF